MSNAKEIFDWELDRSANIANIPCDQTLFCGPSAGLGISGCSTCGRPDASGVQTFGHAGAGRFYISLNPDGVWQVQVIAIPPRVAYSGKGNGPGDTQMFTIPASAPYWQVDWSYNCHPSGQQGTFDYTVETPIGQDTTDYITPNQAGWGYTAANRYYDHGTFYLSVNADVGCVWSVQVVD